VQIEWDMPSDYWRNQMMQDFPDPRVSRVPSDWQKYKKLIQPLVGAFVGAKPDSFKAMPADKTKHAKPFPTPRSWTKAIDVLAACRSVGFGFDHAVTVKLLMGAIGSAAAVEFFAYAKNLDLPDPESILANPKGLELPDRGDVSWAILMGVVSAVAGNSTIDRWTRAWAVLEQACKQKREDIAAVCAKRLVLDNIRPKGSEIPRTFDALTPILTASGLIASRNAN
jgi:hypothetical protein